MLIGLLEDEIAQAQMLIGWLEQDGHTVFHSLDGNSFLDHYAKNAIDLAILDWQVPGKSGIEILTILRTKYDCKIPILFSTQRNAETDIVRALEAGADDYLTKPVRHAELLARIGALSRRAGIATEDKTNSYGPFTIDTQNESILLDNKPIKLTKMDYKVAVSLFSNMGKVLSREFLLKSVWGVDCGLDTRTVDVHVSRVRRALKIDPQMGYVIKTIYQHGYRLEKIDT